MPSVSCMLELCKKTIMKTPTAPTAYVSTPLLRKPCLTPESLTLRMRLPPRRPFCVVFLWTDEAEASGPSTPVVATTLKWCRRPSQAVHGDAEPFRTFFLTP